MSIILDKSWMLAISGGSKASLGVHETQKWTGKSAEEPTSEEWTVGGDSTHDQSLNVSLDC